MFKPFLCCFFSLPQVTKALDALLVGLSDVAKKASEKLGPSATEAEIVATTIKLCLGADGVVASFAARGETRHRGCRGS